MCKKNITKIKEGGAKKFVFGVYFIIPIVVTILIYLSVYKILKNYVSMLQIEGSQISNSEYTIEHIFEPFISSMLLIISLFVSTILIKILSSVFDKKDKSFDVKFAKKIIFWVTILTVLLSTIAFFYSRSNSFEYYRYGFEKIETETSYLPLAEIPSIRGGNLTSKQAPILYRLIYYSANLLKQVEGKFDLIISIAGAILIPLTIKIEKSEEK